MTEPTDKAREVALRWIWSDPTIGQLEWAAGDDSAWEPCEDTASLAAVLADAYGRGRQDQREITAAARQAYTTAQHACELLMGATHAESETTDGQCNICDAVEAYAAEQVRLERERLRAEAEKLVERYKKDGEVLEIYARDLHFDLMDALRNPEPHPMTPLPPRS